MPSGLVFTCSRLFFDDAAEGGLRRRLAAGDGLEVLDLVPLDVDRDPVLGTELGKNLIDALGNRGIGLGSTHALWIEGLQMLYRPIDALVAIPLVMLLLLARSVPVD